MPTIRPGPHEVRAGFASAAHARGFPLFEPLLPAEHGRGGNRGPFPSTRAAPLHTPRTGTATVPAASNPYAGLFTGSALDQANKIADYLLGPYKDQYNQQLAARHALDATRLKQLQDYIAGIAAQFQGVAPAVLAAYRAASGDQSQIAQGFSGDIRDAVQASANQDNALLSEIGAPSGQMIPGQQATDVGDVTFGLGGWIPATLMSQLGARAYADAAKIPATISARGLSAVSDLVGSQQEADAAAQAAYDQVLAQRPGNVLDLYGQIKDRQAAALEAKQKAKADALKARQDVYDAKTKQAEDLTKSTGYLYVVTKGGTVKRATGRNGKPVYTGDLELVTDKATGITRALNPQTGELVWARQTQTPQPGAAAEPPKTINGPDGLYAWQPGKKPGVWNLVPIGPRKQVAEKPPSTFQGPDGLYYWKPRKGGGFDPVPIGPRKPPDMPDVNYRTVGNNVVAFWFDPKTNKPQQQIVYQGTAEQKLQVVQTGDGGYDIVDLSVPGGEVVKSFPAVTQTIGGDGSGSGSDGSKYYSSGAAWIQQPDGSMKFRPPPPQAAKRGRASTSPNAPTSILDPDTKIPLTRRDVQQRTADVRETIKGDRRHGVRLEDTIALFQREGIPDEIWVPIVMNQYQIPRSTRDLKNMRIGRLHNLAVMMGYQPDQAHPLDKKGLIDWITARSGKGRAAGEAAASAGGRGEYAYPLQTRGKVIGLPYQGTHLLYGNWESDNAIDIAIPVGTPIYAVADGVIGSRIGPLDSSGDPRLAGQRLHLETDDNEFYYAHLSRLAVKAGQHVKKGQLIGYSGSANGAAHLHIAAKDGNPVDYFSPKAAGKQAIEPQQSNDVKLAMTPSGARQVAKRMARLRGWTAKQWRDLNVLIQSESGWNYRAWHNPGTGRADVWKGNAPPPRGAFGIGQALGHELPPDYATNPVTQINWLFQYIADRYGNDPSKALQFKLEHGGLHGGWY